MKIIVTGGAGFIGSALVRLLINETRHEVLNIDKLTYAGNLASLAVIESHPRYSFVQGDICHAPLVDHIFEKFRPDGIIHLAAESHVDRSIDGPATCVQTNIIGTYVLLEAARRYLSGLSEPERFRFLHVSTDEVYGSLPETGRFVESTAYDPRSPYSASKAASDHLVAAWGHTFNVPIIISNCSNNYGPYQFPEKFIPLCITKALADAPLPIYGSGRNIRDWLFVEDHARALQLILEKGTPGNKYNVGGDAERQNIDVAYAICALLDQLHPRNSNKPYRDLITFVADRPGHDQRYAIDATKIAKNLGWHPRHDFEEGLEETVKWYLANTNWWQSALLQQYDGQRLGLGRSRSDFYGTKGTQNIPGV